uniref:FTH domain-containing protein n=1 Tax=Panagrellus redivivus TaxID=6233 RepID=A0A7E4V5G0_PANRE
MPDSERPTLIHILSLCKGDVDPEVRFDRLENFVITCPDEKPAVNRMLKRCKKCCYVHTEAFKFEIKQMEFVWKVTKPESDLVKTIIKHANSIEITNTILSNSQSRLPLSKWFTDALAERTKDAHVDFTFSTVRQLVAVIPFKCVVGITISKTTDNMCTVIGHNKHIQSVTLGDYDDEMPLPPVSALALPIGNRNFDVARLCKSVHPSTETLSLLLHLRNFDDMMFRIAWLLRTKVKQLIVSICFQESPTTAGQVGTNQRAIQVYSQQMKLFVTKTLTASTVDSVILSVDMDLVHVTPETQDESLEEVLQRANKHNTVNDTDDVIDFIEIPLIHTSKHYVKLSALY